MKKIVGLCVGRHEIKEVEEYIYPIEVNPLDLRGLEQQAEIALEDVEALDLYVTGLTVALVAVLNVCYQKDIATTLYHYNKENGEYYPQRIARPYYPGKF